MPGSFAVWQSKTIPGRPSVRTPRGANGRTNIVRHLFADASGQTATLSMRAGRQLRNILVPHVDVAGLLSRKPSEYSA